MRAPIARRSSSPRGITSPSGSATRPAVIGFDVLNEPTWGTYPLFQFEHDRLMPLYQDVVATVRAVAPAWVAFVEPGASRNGGIATKLADLPFADVMYAPHSYDQTAEGGGGFDPTHRQQILDNVERSGRRGARARTPACGSASTAAVATAPDIVDYMTAQYDAAGQVAASTMYWSYDKSDGYGLLTPDGSEKAVLLGALVRPYPERVAGDPISYALRRGDAHVHVRLHAGSGARRADRDRRAHAQLPDRLSGRVRRMPVRDRAWQAVHHRTVVDEPLDHHHPVIDPARSRLITHRRRRAPRPSPSGDRSGSVAVDHAPSSTSPSTITIR